MTRAQLVAILEKYQINTGCSGRACGKWHHRCLLTDLLGVQPSREGLEKVCKAYVENVRSGTGYHNFIDALMAWATATPPTTCGICGGETVEIRGRFPQEERRRTCPTCTQERLDQVREISDRHYGVAQTARPGA